MEKVYIKLLKDWGDFYKAGDVIEVKSGLVPIRLIKNGIAERYIPSKEER